jgi:MFS family permease
VPLRSSCITQTAVALITEQAYGYRGASALSGCTSGLFVGGVKGAIAGCVVHHIFTSEHLLFSIPIRNKDIATIIRGEGDYFMALPAKQTKDLAVQKQSDQQMASFRRVLTNRNFLLLWLAQLISQTILNAANFGIVVLVQDTTRSPFLTGLALISFLLPGVPFSALAGVIVDRLNKRQVLWISNLLRVLTMLLICASLLYNRDDLLPLFILIFLTSLISQFFTPAEGASIPLLVGESELMPALSLFNITITVAQAVGFLALGRIVAALFPPFTLHVGVLVLSVQSIDMLFVIVALLYLVCVVLILLIPIQALNQEHVQDKDNPLKLSDEFDLGKAVADLWHDMLESWKTVRADRYLFFGVIQLSLAGIIMQLIGALAPTFVQQVLHRPAEDMSTVLAPAAVGLVGASILLPRITGRFGKIHLTVSALIVMALGFGLLVVNQGLAALIDPAHSTTSPLLFWSTLAVVFILGIAMAAVNIPAQTLMQERSPEECRARILALQLTLYNAGTIPILLFAGAFAQFIGLNPTIIVIAACMLASSWWGARYVR